jgi:hypothetical protein
MRTSAIDQPPACVELSREYPPFLLRISIPLSPLSTA